MSPETRPAKRPETRPETRPDVRSETRASDAEREQVAERLREALAEGRLNMVEFDERLEATFKARTHGELVPLVRDLPEPGTLLTPGAAVAASGATSGAAVSERGADGGWADRVGQGPATSKGAFAFWSGFRRRGRWTVGRMFTAAVFQAGGEIDLREASFEGREVVIRCFALMGGVHVTVPHDLDVEVRGFGIMGGFGEAGDVRSEVAPGAPRVVITGFALMGGVGVERKLRESEKRRLKEERKRLKLEKKAARGERRDE